MLKLKLKLTPARLRDFFADDRNVWIALLTLIIVALLVLIGVAECNVSPRGVLGPTWPPATPTPGGVTILSWRDGTTLHAFSISDDMRSSALFTFRASIVADETGDPLPAQVEVTTGDGERAVHSGVDRFSVHASKTFTVTVTAAGCQPWGLRFAPHVRSSKVMSGVIRLKCSQ